MWSYRDQKLLDQLDEILEGKDKKCSVKVQGNDIKRIKQIRRKLLLRKAQAEHGVEAFDIHSQWKKIKARKVDQRTGEAQKKLDIFTSHKNNSERLSSQDFLVCSPVTRAVQSPYTGRSLKPYIRRSFDQIPRKLLLHNELQRRICPADRDPIETHPIDYCYVQRQHIPVINRLARRFFWPGIDVSESLEHPDFSCVVLYRQLVIGFAFLLPNVSHTEAYVTFLFVHPDWRGAGIAKFMIYHLIQTCTGKDLILHVSANNPALFLYHQFGFKVEEKVSDFYDKYLPPESNECRHALFLRLSR